MIIPHMPTMLNRGAGLPDFPHVLSTHGWEPNTGQGTTTNNYPMGDMSGADMIIFAVYNQSGSHINGHSGTGWSRLISEGGARLAVFVKNDPTSSEVISITGSTNIYTAAVAFRIEGANTARLTGSITDATSVFTGPNPPNVNTGVLRNHLWIAFGCKGSTASGTDSVTSAPAFFSDFEAHTASVNAASQAYSCAAGADREFQGTSLDPGTFGYSGSSNTAAANFALWRA